MTTRVTREYPSQVSVCYLVFLCRNFLFLIYRVQPRHHGTQFTTDLLNLVLSISPAHRLKTGPAGLVLKNPARGKGSILDFMQYPAHFIACPRIDDARTRNIIAKLGSIANGVAHITHAALVHQVNDQFHFMHAFKVRDLRLIASLYQGLKTCAD